ncbi:MULTISPECIES: hypothetical protein [Priestia]|uniref:hypothetical protein n=1 Tax=Priestia TaxID=2800373 RepID=UPI001C8D58EA|nr:hypothetical protein [Priestia aryabhattai]MBY0210630.1 hypothetical protein [Priestia aryabhattai]
MFKISTLTMYSLKGEEYTYKFNDGLNYFKGVNNSGKTEFYKFIDYMFGASNDLTKKPWYFETFEKATMVFELDGIGYRITRTRDPQKNYFTYYQDSQDYNEVIDPTEYKAKLNSIFAKGEAHILRGMRNFTNENLTYRTFTMFNFLGEKRQGITYNFLDKCDDIKYYSKLNSILNYIFNNNLERIAELQSRLVELQKQLKNLEMTAARNLFITEQINSNLKKLDTQKFYNGKNKDEILYFISQYKNLDEITQKKKSKNIVDLEVSFNSIDEQIKIYENRVFDTKQIQTENENRKKLLKKLENLLEESEVFDYLVDPLKNLLNELDHSISFSKYLINDKTIQDLKLKRELLKKEIKDDDNRFKIFSVEEKSKSIALIEEYLSADTNSVGKELEEMKKTIREIKNDLKALQNSDDHKKIKKISNCITELYESAASISEVVKEDVKQNGFKILYLKKGNVLQPVIKKINEESKEEEVNYYVGSMARHTLIQLSGYLAFMIFMLLERKYPLIPLIVIDHISKPFDNDNKKAIGQIISAAYRKISKKNLQLFIFDDNEYKNLGLEIDHSENLVTSDKTGFLPFYFPHVN